MIERISGSTPWQERLPEDATERVAAQILRKAGNAVAALAVVREADTLIAVLDGTDLSEDAKARGSKGDGPLGQVALNLEEELGTARTDAGEVIGELWTYFRKRIEATGGEVSQTITVTVTWNPPSENRDGFIGTSARMTVQGKKITRTGRVERKRGGNYQFALFGERGEEE